MAVGVITLIICKTATAAKACSRVFRWASPTEALGSTTVGTAVPRTATRSVCQSQIGPTSAVAQDTYLRCARSETALVGPTMPGSFYGAYTLQSWRPICAMAKAILPGCFWTMAMEQQLFFATFCRTKKPWDKAPSMELPNSHVLLELGLCKFGRMLLPHSPTETCWFDAAYCGLQSLMSSQRKKLQCWRFSGKKPVAKGLWMLKLGSSPWFSRRFVVTLGAMHYSPDLQQLLCLELYQSFLSGLF